MNSEMHKLATIASRYSAVNSVAKGAKNQLQELRSQLFVELITPEEMEVLAQAQRIMEKIEGRSSVWNALDYYQDLPEYDDFLKQLE